MLESHGLWNTKVENNLEKGELKPQKNEDENVPLFFTSAAAS